MTTNAVRNAGWKTFCIIALATVALATSLMACGPDQQDGKSSRRDRKDNDLESGTEFIVAMQSAVSGDSQTLDNTIEILRHRLDALELDDAQLKPMDGKLRIRIPRVDDRTRVKRLLFTRCEIGFRFAYDADNPILYQAPSEEQLLEVHGGTLPEGTEIVAKIDLSPGRVGRIVDYLLLEQKTLLSSTHIEEANAAPSQYSGFAVMIHLTGEGGDIMRGLSSQENFGRLLAIVIDGRCVMAASIQGEIGADVQLSGNIDEALAKDLALLLDSGMLPVDLVIESENAFGKDEDQGEDSELPETIWPF